MRIIRNRKLRGCVSVCVCVCVCVKALMNLYHKAQEPRGVTNDAGFLCGKESLLAAGDKQNRSVSSDFIDLEIVTFISLQFNYFMNK